MHTCRREVANLACSPFAHQAAFLCQAERNPAVTPCLPEGFPYQPCPVAAADFVVATAVAQALEAVAVKVWKLMRRNLPGQQLMQ